MRKSNRPYNLALAIIAVLAFGVALIAHGYGESARNAILLKDDSLHTLRADYRGLQKVNLTLENQLWLSEDRFRRIETDIDTLKLFYYKQRYSR